MLLLAQILGLVAVLPLAIPDPSPITPPGFEAPVGLIIGMLRWGGLALAVAGIIIVGARLTINIRRGEAAHEIGMLGAIGLGIMLIGGAAALVGFISGA